MDDHYHYGSYTTFLPQEARPYADALPHYWQALTLLAGAAVVPLLAVAGTARRPAEASTGKGSESFAYIMSETGKLNFPPPGFFLACSTAPWWSTSQCSSRNGVPRLR